MDFRALFKLQKPALLLLIFCSISSTALGVSIDKTNKLLNSYRNNGGIHSGWVYFMDWFRMDAEDVIKERMETLAKNNINVVVFSNNLLRYAHFIESEEP